MTADTVVSPEMAAAAHDGAKAVALRYLALMEARDLAGAQRLVAPDAAYVFPGGARLTSLSAIVAGSAGRYQHVAKHVERCDLCAGADGRDVVYILGTLYGRWTDGSTFAGIRFVDRFEIREGLIVLQEVWNDIGEYRLALA